MKKLDNAIETKIKSYINDNRKYIKESGCETVAEYLLSDLYDEDGYWWYLEPDDNDTLTEADKKMVVDYININYGYSIDELKKNKTTMKTQLKPDQGWVSLRAAAAKIYKENGEKMRVKFCDNEYELKTEEWNGVHWYAGTIDEEVAAIFMDTAGKGFKYYHLIIDPLLRAQIVKVTLFNCEFHKERKQINEKLIKIL